MSSIKPHLAKHLKRFPADRYVIAYSGGVDSHVLLHAFAALRQEQASLDICAVHVHHGLQVKADDWAQHCERVCADLAIPLKTLHVDARPKSGESPESAARDARYDALRAYIHPTDILCTAQHADDQAETLLLQLLRGAGAAGLASMPESAAFAEGQLNRPLLTIDRASIAAYAEKYQLKWVEDDSNQDLSFDRNYLRQRVVPRIKERWPAQAKVLSRVASIQADHALLLQQLAELDMQQGIGKSREALSIAALKRLPLERQRNLIRFWVESNGFSAPSHAKLEHIINDILLCKPDRTPVVHWGEQEVRRNNDDLLVMASLAKHDSAQQYQWDYRQPLLLEGLSGQLEAKPTKSGGIVLPDHTACLRVCFRSGGEKIQHQANGRQRTLKNLMQEAGIASWQRDRIPLIYLDDELIAVVGYWASAHYVCPAGQSGLLFELTDC